MTENQALEYSCTTRAWRKACKSTYGTQAVCTRPKHHALPCIYTVSRSYEAEERKRKQEEQGLIDEANKQKEKDMAKKADESGEKSKKIGSKRGNSEALAKAREAGAAAREEARKKKIKLLVKTNPKREGSASYDRFALYRSGMTVGEFLEKGGRSADITYDVAHEYIEVK